MARKSFLYYLFSKNKKPLYVDDNGFVIEGTDDYFKPDGQPARLELSPDGWKDTLVKFARNIKYFGLFRDYTVPMKFVGDGAAILRHQMWHFGLEGVTYLGIAKLDRTGLPYNYYSWYLSEINFAKYRQTKTGVNTEALEGGLSKLLKAYENTTYEIAVDDDPEHILVLMDGMEFDFNRKCNIIPDQAITGTANYYLGQVETSREGITPEINFADLLPKQSSPYPNEDYFLQSKKTQEFTVSGRIKIYFNRTTPFELRIETNDGVSSSGFPQYSLVNIAGSPRSAGTTEEFSFNETFTLPAGSRAHMKIYGGSSPLTEFTVLEGEITVDYVYRHPQSYIKALYPFRVLEKLVYKITDGQYTCESNFLQNLTDYCITSGDALRGLTAAVIKTSLADFFKSFFSRFSIGLTVKDDKLLIEPLSHFFDSSIIADIGSVDDAEITLAEDLVFNSIKAGYAKQEYTDANGRYETNQGQAWSTPITKIIRETDLTSPYRADPFGIELLRINFEERKTTDSNSDNDTFLLNITQEPENDPGEFRAQVTGVHSYSGTSLVEYDTVNPGPSFTANTLKTEFTYNSPINQNIAFSISLTPTGGGGVTEIQVAVLKNGVAVYSQMFPIGGTNGFTTNFAIAQNDVISVQVAGMAGALNVNQSNVAFNYVVNGSYLLNRPAYTSVTGIPHPDTAFNLELSPKKGLLNNGAYIHSIMDLLDTSAIKLQSADKNKELVTVLNGVTVDEDADIQIGSLPAQLFKPYYINFRTQVPINLVELLKVNPFGRIKFTYNSTVFYGFLMDGGIKPANNDSQVWKLLCAPENDLKLFYNG